MKLFVFNDKSILNNGVARTFNSVSLGIVIFIGITDNVEYDIKMRSLIILIIISSVLTAYASWKVIKNTDFFEWDYTERKKKSRFATTYLLVCSILCSLFVLSGYMAYLFMLHDMPIAGKMLGIIPTLILGFNVLNIVSLFYPLFEEDLTLGYKVQKKPDNWIDEGMEIKNEDEAKEIMHRDFGI